MKNITLFILILSSLLFSQDKQNDPIKDSIRVYFSQDGIKYFEENIMSIIEENIGVNPGYIERMDYVTEFQFPDIYKEQIPGAKTLEKMKSKMLTRLNNRFLRLINKKSSQLSLDSMIFQAQWDKASFKANSKYSDKFSFSKKDFLFSLDAVVEASNLNFYMKGLKLKNKYLSLYDQNELNIFTSSDSTSLKFKVEIGFYKDGDVFKVEVLKPYINVAEILLNLNYKHKIPLDLSIADIEVSLDGDKIWLYKNGAPLESDDYDTKQAKLDSQALKNDLLAFIPVQVDEYLVKEYAQTVKAIKDTVQKVFDESAQGYFEESVNAFFATGVKSGDLLPAVAADLTYLNHDCSLRTAKENYKTGEFILDKEGKRQYHEAATKLIDPETGESVTEVELSESDLALQTPAFRYYFEDTYKNIFSNKDSEEYASFFTEDGKLKLVCSFEWNISMSDLGTHQERFFIKFDGNVGDTNKAQTLKNHKFPYAGEGNNDGNDSKIDDYDVTLSFDIGVVNKVLELSFLRKYFDEVLVGETKEDGVLTLSKEPRVFIQDNQLKAEVNIAYPRNSVEMGGFKKFIMKTFLVKNWVLLKMNINIDLSLNSDGTYKISIGDLDQDSIGVDSAAYKLIGKIFKGSLTKGIKEAVIKATTTLSGTEMAKRVPIPTELGVIRLKHKDVGIDNSGRIMFYTDLVK